MVSFAIIYNKDIVLYDFGKGHPFRGQRFIDYMDLIEEKGLLNDPLLKIIKSSNAENSDLLLVHSKDYIDDVTVRAKTSTPLTKDTPLNPAIVKGAQAIVGSSLKAAELVANGVVKLAEGVGGGLHHAGKNYGGGFCVYNDVAICTQALLDRHGLERVLIFDTDVHAGNGTMDIFYENPKVLFISVHQDPHTLYPGTGFIDDIGIGEGEGSTINIPLPPKADDKCMELALDELFTPLVREFKPQVIIRNGGSDPHFMDGLGSLNLSFKGLRNIGQVVASAAADTRCGVVDLCCSGYNPRTVAQGWLALLSGVAGLDISFNEYLPLPTVSDHVLVETEKVVRDVKAKLAEYWTF